MHTMSICRICVVGVGMIGLVGCENTGGTSAVSQASKAAGQAVAASTVELPLVPHPEYAHWSRFPVGTGAIRKKEVTNDFGTIRVTTALHLVEKTDAKVVVESQVTVDRGDDSPTMNPPLKMEFPATFRLPAGMKVEQFALPSQKAKSQGAESRQSCGREFQAELFTWNEVNEAGPMAVKLWWSDEIPGRMLRQEINGHNHTSVEEVVEIFEKGQN